MDNKDYLGLLLQNITQSLPSSKIKDIGKHLAVAEAFPEPSHERLPWILLPINECRNHFQLLRFQCWVPKLLWSPNYTSYRAQWTVSMWFGLYYDWTTLGGLEKVGVRVPEFMGNLWRKQNTAIWLKTHNFMQQTQNLVLTCNPTIHTRDMLGSTQLYPTTYGGQGGKSPFAGAMGQPRQPTVQVLHIRIQITTSSIYADLVQVALCVIP